MSLYARWGKESKSGEKEGVRGEGEERERIRRGEGETLR